MPNNSYQRGASLERRLVNDYRANGYAAYRVAGSRGVADVIAIRSGEVILAQCKTGGNKYAGLGPAARKLLSEEAALAGGRAVLVYRGTRQRNYRVIPEGDWPDA